MDVEFIRNKYEDGSEGFVLKKSEYNFTIDIERLQRITGIVTANNGPQKKLKVAQRAMERAMLGVPLGDHIRNDEIRERSNVTNKTPRIARIKIKWQCKTS